MKVQRSTLILVGLALMLGAGVILSESQWVKSLKSKTNPGVEDTQSPILTFSEGEVQEIALERGEETLSLERQPDDTWRLTRPTQGQAEAGAVAFLLSRLNTDRPLQTVTMQPEETPDFGFTQPTGTVTLTLADDRRHTLILGGPDFSGSAYYAVLDPPSWPPQAGGEPYSVLVVNADVATAIQRPLGEWQAASTEKPASPEDPSGGDADRPEPTAPSVDMPAQSDNSEAPPAPEIPAPSQGE
ncbi:MAG: DUF4340 domain-containing protein [Nodosilinea sp.]